MIVVCFACHANAQASGDSATGSQAVGLYTTEQAQQGRKAYARECASCHGAGLRGGEASPTLIGDRFLRKWNGSVAALFAYTQTTMPVDRPGKLRPQVTAAIVAHILQKNRFPAGDTELPSEVVDLGELKLDRGDATEN